MSIIKFTHLQVGQQFEYQGEHYTKVAPLIASNDANGKQRMIPRSANVTVSQEAAPAATPPEQGTHPALALLERYHQTALAELQAMGGDVERLSTARARLETLREELVTAIRQA